MARWSSPGGAGGGILARVDIPVSDQSPQLARARAILAAAVRERTGEEAGDVGVLDFDDALTIASAVTPPLPLPVPLDAGGPPTRAAAVGALREAIAAATGPGEALRLAEAARALSLPASV